MKANNNQDKKPQTSGLLWDDDPRLPLAEQILNSDDNDNWLNKVETDFVTESRNRKIFITCRNWGIAIVVILGLGTGLAFSLIGQKNALTGQIEASRQAFDAKTAKDFLPSRQAIAENYYNRGNEQADSKYIENFPNILAKSSTNAQKYDDYVNRGVIYYRQKKYALAIEDYKEAIALAPKHIQAYINRGIAYSSLGNHERAIADYDEALKIDTDNADAYINRGIAYFSQGDQERAIADYDEALKIEPDNADAYYAKGLTLALREGEKQEAIKNYKKAADLYQQQKKPSYHENALKKIEELSTSESP